jgi:chemotaxis signal transduction protein
MTVGTVIRRVESSTKVPEEERRQSTKVSKEDKKKYVRRRYTDSRHPTTNFPDVEALEAASSTDSSSKPSQVWKRRELIASDPKDHETFV